MTTPKAAILKSVKTRVDTATVYNHYIHIFANLDSDDPICKSLELYGVRSLPDLLDLDRDEMRALEYINASNNRTPLHRGGQGRVRVMQAYFRYLREEEIEDIMSLTHEDFNDYRMDIYDANALPTVSPTRTREPLVPPVARQPAEEFKRGIKRDKTHYISLKENKQWDDWHRSPLATARSHGCEEVFNPKYKPKTWQNVIVRSKT